jgi:Na+/H+-dicarboxylate symporter
MYHIAIDINVLLIIIFGTMMISMAISGLPCLVGVSLISTLLESIGVPPGVSSAILLAIFPIIDPPLTILNCLGNCTYSSILARTPAVAKIPLAHEDAQNSMA